MSRFAKQIVLLISLFCLALPVFAQKSGQHLRLGWDLTYSSLLRRNNIAHDEWMWKWLGRNYHSPVKSVLETWKGEHIVSSTLIETPATLKHIITLWWVRTENYAYYWFFLDGKPYGHNKEIVNPDIYDRFSRSHPKTLLRVVKAQAR